MKSFTTLGAADAATVGREPSDLLPAGSVVNGRYVIDACLGTGGMGTVYRVTDQLAADRPMALKTLRSDAISPDRLDLLKGEFRTMTAFHHPNVAGVYDLEAIPGTGTCLFTMEFVEGRDIYAATDGADHETILDLVVQICRALSYVHSRDVIHFDLKPTNVLVTTVGRVKVLDFGIAGAAHQTERSFVGTPAYMAPELVDIGRADHRADLYSLGILLYQLLTRSVPFHADRVGELLRMHASDPIDFERPEARSVPRWLREIIERLCDKQAANRFRSADAVIDAINRHGGRTYELETPQTRESYILSSRFIGRERELAQALDFVSRRTAGAPVAPMLLVSGTSGVGKSRLMREVRHHAQLTGLVFVETNCYEGSLSENGPVADVLKHLVRLAEAFGAGALARAAPAALVDPKPSAESRVDAENPERERLRLREQPTEFLVRLAEVVPYALYFNDLQWAQPGTVDILAHLLRRLAIAARSGAPVPLAVLGTFRDEEIAGRPFEALLTELQEWRAAETIALRPLDADDVEALVASMLGADPPVAFVDRVTRETTGVPFFVEEVMRALVENGSVYLEAGRWAAAHDIRDLPIPTSIVNVLRRRVTALHSPAQQILTTLAAYGRPIPASLLTAATALQPSDLVSSLKLLLHRQMAIQLPGEPVTYTVAHDRLREAVSGDLASVDRRRLHGAISDAIEHVWADELDEHIYELAQHCWLAGDRARALTYSLRGAERARRTYANDVAIELFGRVLGLLDEDASALRLEVTEKLGDLFALNGRFDEALSRYDVVMAALGARRDQARLLRKVASVHWQKGELGTSADRLWQSVTSLGESRPHSRIGEVGALLSTVRAHLKHRAWNPRRRVEPADREQLLELAATYFQLGEVYFFHDSSQMLLPTLRASNAGERAGGDSSELARAYHAVMVLYGTLTLWGSAELYARRISEMAERLGSPWDIGAAHTYRLILDYYRGNWAHGIQRGRQGKEVLARCGDVMELSFAYWVTALCHYYRGELREAADWCREGLDTMQRTASEQPSKGILAVMGRVNARLGLIADARAQIERSLALATQARDLMFLAWAQMMMGDCLLVAGQADEAVVWLENARRLREDNRLLPEYLVEIYPLLALARLEQLEGQRNMRQWQRRRRLREIAGVARKGMRLARRRRHHYAPAARAAAICAWHLGRRRRSRALFASSLAVARQLGSPLQLAETLEASGRCLLETDPQAARDQFARALDIFQRTGATPFAARVEARLAGCRTS